MTILCEPDAQLAAVLAAFIGDDVRTVGDLASAAAALDAAPSETLLVIGAGVDLNATLQFASARIRMSPATAVILVRDRPSAVVVRAVEAGICEVIATDDREGLAIACRPFVAMAAHPSAAGTRGQLITVYAAKDGSGKTTFATNLAVALHDGGAQRVCLVDLDLEFGDIARTLRVSPKRTLADTGHLGTRIDIAAALGLVTQLRPGLDAIFAPVVAGQAVKVPVALVESLLDALPAAYDHVVVDTPAHFSPHVLAALDRSDHRVLLATPESPTLTSLRELLDTLDLLAYERRTRSVVVNRAGSRDGLAPAAVEKALKGRVACWIPSSEDVPVSINRGIPLAASQPDHPVSVAVRQFATTRLLAVQPGCVKPSGPA